MRTIEIACGGLTYDQLCQALAAPVAEQVELAV